MKQSHMPFVSADTGHSFGNRLDNIGWAIFLILTGAVWLVPEAQVPPGTWLIGTGVLLLCLNAVRATIKVPVSGFGILLGVLALAAGLAAFWGIRFPLVAIALILLGLGLFAREVFRRA